MKTHCINGEWLAGSGPALYSQNPATGEIIWEGTHALLQDITQAVRSARNALGSWSLKTPQERWPYLEAFGQKLKEKSKDMAEQISVETGKPLWESKTEVEAMIGKVGNTLQAFQERCPEKMTDGGGMRTATRYKPHGVLAVYAPFNLPGHLAGSHILPALLAGNTLVFKPSEHTPAVGQLLMEIWEAAGLPPGVLNLIQGGRDTGALLLQQQNLDGVLFTGSVATGKSIAQVMAATPGKILALELGGNNPLLFWGATPLKTAAYLTLLSAYITAGQRCTCARRLIIPDNSSGQAFLDCLIPMIQKIQIGPFTENPEPFMGPLISLSAAQKALSTQQGLIHSGARALLSMKIIREQTPFLSPGLLDVTAIKNRPDAECFGPLLQVIRVKDFDAALAEANNTAFGLTASLLCDDEALYQKYYGTARAGMLHWNRPTTGTTGLQPFGGTGDSGNLRPSGYFSVDYCSYPVASLESKALVMPEKTLPGIDAA